MQSSATAVVLPQDGSFQPCCHSDSETWATATRNARLALTRLCGDDAERNAGQCAQRSLVRCGSLGAQISPRATWQRSLCEQRRFEDSVQIRCNPEHSCLVYSPCWQLTGSDVRLALLRSNIIQDRWLTYGGDIVDASDALTVELLHSNLPQCGIEDRQARQAPCVFIASSHAVRIACEAARTFNIE